MVLSLLPNPFLGERGRRATPDLTSLAMAENLLASPVERVRIDSLTPHPDNPRQGDIGAISESLNAHGQFRSIVAQKSTRHVLAGNHTMAAARALGWPEIDVQWVDVDDEQARRILIADNRTASLGHDDPTLLLTLLQELVTTESGLAGTAFDGDDLDDVIRLVEMPAVYDMPEGPPPLERTPSEQTCPACGHSWTP